MISERDKSAIRNVAARYGAGRVLLFGSAAAASSDARDIDLAVEGLPPAKFFAFYGDLLFLLSKPVDLVDMSRESPSTRIIRQVGIPVYVSA